MFIKTTLISLILLFFAGCANNQQIVTVTEYKEVFVPARCDVFIPNRPKNSGDIVEDVKKLAIHAEELECLLKKCKGKKCE